MSRDLSQRVQRIKPSATIAVSAKAETLTAQGQDIINLGIGEPDFDTPKHIKEAGIKAISEGRTKYTAVDGILPLKKAIIEKFRHDNQIDYQLDQILVSCGAKHSLYNLFCSILNPQDEVIIQAPYWVSYPDMVKLTDAEPVIIKTGIQQKFKMTPEQLEARITPKTKLLILGSPSNPTGVMYTEEELKKLSEVLLKHPQVLIVSDDIYEPHVWEHLTFSNILMACRELYDRTILVNSVSKSYAMTGWRIGYAAGPAHIISSMKKAQSQSTSNPCTISQYASLAALTGDQTCVKEMTRAYKERHDVLLKGLNEIPGLFAIPSDGTFYTFPNAEELIARLNLNNDIELADFLLDKASIAAVPGSAFGASGYIRFCYTTSMERIQEGLERLQFLKN